MMLANARDNSILCGLVIHRFSRQNHVGCMRLEYCLHTLNTKGRCWAAEDSWNQLLIRDYCLKYLQGQFKTRT